PDVRPPSRRLEATSSVGSDGPGRKGSAWAWQALLECEDHQREIVVELPRGRSRFIDRAVQPLRLGPPLERLLRKQWDEVRQASHLAVLGRHLAHAIAEYVQRAAGGNERRLQLIWLARQRPDNDVPVPDRVRPPPGRIPHVPPVVA